ncbi:MAG: hypothetical protein JWM85_1425 [Acidimicrobiaceae bacterium]|nr:hypothetical protein [Acidimicrobiaceae bacterium]
MVALALLVIHRVHSGGKPRTGAAVSSHAPAKPLRLNVGIASCTFVDHSRTTHDYATNTDTPGRTLVTEIRYPTTNGRSGVETAGAHPALRHGPYPLIVFAHGYTIDPVVYQKLLDAWVRAGFVVAAPLFPDTESAAVSAGTGAEQDIINQPADVAFVTRRLKVAAARGSGCSVLRGLERTGAVALAGQSDGGDTVASLAYFSGDAPLMTGLGVRAVAILSGEEDMAAGSGTYRAVPGSPPLLFVQSRNDTCNTPQQATLLYNAVQQADKWFLETSSVAHLGPYTGAEPAQFAAVAAETTAYFGAELDGASLNAVGMALRRSLAGHGAVASLKAGGSAPAMPGQNASVASCYVDS